MNPHRVLIIGGGFAGLKCASELANDHRFQVTLLDRQNHHCFQPLLYQVATAALSAPDISRSLRALLHRAENVAVLMDEVVKIDPESQTLHTPIKRYPYDTLILAAGAQTSYFGNDEWSKHSIGLKSLKDARDIRKSVLEALETAERIDNPELRRRLMTICIVGGGPTGVELAGAFSDLVRRALKQDYRNIDPENLRVVLVHSGERILPWFTEEHSAYAKERLEKGGVEIRLNDRVDDIQEKRVHLKNSEEWIEAETIIWAAGVKASPLTENFDVPRDRGGRLEVEPDLSLPGYENVYAAGDLVKFEGVPGVAQGALQMGEHIAKQLITGKNRPFSYFDKGMMAIIGRNAAVVEARGVDLRGFPAWAAWLFIHITFLVGFSNKLTVLIAWAFNYVFDKPGARVFSSGGSKEEPRKEANQAA